MTSLLVSPGTRPKKRTSKRQHLVVGAKGKHGHEHASRFHFIALRVPMGRQ